MACAFLLLSLIKVSKPLLSLSLIFKSYNALAKASTCVGIKSLMISLPLRFEVNNTSSNKGLPKPLKMARIDCCTVPSPKEVSKFLISS